ncbi:MAG: putative glycosyltransferase EpsH [Lentisphaerae bacterium ADurb.Bin082]|nr:MAG: putative glycosyltransferase EpsH [Lentisphaerae bacterium ADurb.Bin082]
MQKTLVSIIVTCYNRAGMVCKALDSVYAQTYRPLELVIVDDGSKDNSMKVIEAWKASHPDGDGFTCIAKTFPNGKLCLARNRGNELSHGEWIQYVDDDDWLYPTCIEEKMTYIAAHPERDVVVHQVEYIVSGGKSIGSSKLTLASDDSRQLLHLLDTRTDTLFSPTLMLRRTALDAIGGWTNGLIFADDIDVVFRLAAKETKFGIVDKALSAYNMHDADRQCNKVIHQLPDDFWSSLFLRLWEFFQKTGKTTQDIRDALSGQAAFYARRQMRWGRFQSAWMGFDAASSIRGYAFGIEKLPIACKYPMGWCCFLTYKLKIMVKKLVKAMIR